MCTSINFKTKDHYFGRTLDMYFSYEQKIIITPRKYRIKFKQLGECNNHFAIIGTGVVENGYPLYFDAANEKGLCVAALNFPDYCVYNRFYDKKLNVTPYELILWILTKYEDIDELLNIINDVNIVDLDFSTELPCSPLHWMVSDKNKSIVIEQTKEGLKVVENKIGVLTNSPPFEFQMVNLSNYMNLSPYEPKNEFNKLELKPYSFGLGAFGLPGDLSSTSRFVRAAFTKHNSVCANDEISSVTQFFHIMSTVSQTDGCNIVFKDCGEKTMYTSCYNSDRGIYYYNTYSNNQINAIDINKEDLEKDRLITYDFIDQQKINYQN